MAEALSENKSDRVEDDHPYPSSSFFRTYSKFRSSRIGNNKLDFEKSVKKLLCDTDIEDDDEDVDEVRTRVLKKRRTHDASEDPSNTEEENLGNECSRNKRRV